jgi:hypothetical protein
MFWTISVLEIVSNSISKLWIPFLLEFAIFFTCFVYWQIQQHCRSRFYHLGILSFMFYVLWSWLDSVRKSIRWIWSRLTSLNHFLQLLILIEMLIGGELCHILRSCLDIRFERKDSHSVWNGKKRSNRQFLQRDPSTNCRKCHFWDRQMWQIWTIVLFGIGMFMRIIDLFLKSSTSRNESINSVRQSHIELGLIRKRICWIQLESKCFMRLKYFMKSLCSWRILLRNYSRIGKVTSFARNHNR